MRPGKMICWEDSNEVEIKIEIEVKVEIKVEVKDFMWSILK